MELELETWGLELQGFLHDRAWADIEIAEDFASPTAKLRKRQKRLRQNAARSQAKHEAVASANAASAHAAAARVFRSARVLAKKDHSRIIAAAIGLSMMVAMAAMVFCGLGRHGKAINDIIVLRTRLQKRLPTAAADAHHHVIGKWRLPPWV